MTGRKFTKAEKIKVLAEFAAFLDSLEDNKVYEVSVSEVRQKRTLSANAYFWKMCDLLASRIHESKTAIYREYIKEIGGVSDEIEIKAKAAERFEQIWTGKGLGFQVDFLTDPSEADPEQMIEAVAYYGSSTFSTEQMSRLIEQVVRDCEYFNIPTKDPEELERLLDEWGAR